MCDDNRFNFGMLDCDGDGHVDNEEFLIFMEFLAQREGLERADSLLRHLFMQALPRTPNPAPRHNPDPNPSHKIPCPFASTGAQEAPRAV